MSKYKKLIAAATVSPKSAELMQGLSKIMDEHLLELEDAHPDMYWEVIREIHELIYGCYFDEAMAMYAVTELKNEDGTEGGHWSESETTSVASSAGIGFDKFNRWDWFYTLNMIYSDYYNVIGSDTNMYIKMAAAFLNDKDAPEGKAFKYWMAIC